MKTLKLVAATLVTFAAINTQAQEQKALQKENVKIEKKEMMRKEEVKPAENAQKLDAQNEIKPERYDNAPAQQQTVDKPVAPKTTEEQKVQKIERVEKVQKSEQTVERKKEAPKK
jgi:hypothetical protein